MTTWPAPQKVSFWTFYRVTLVDSESHRTYPGSSSAPIAPQNDPLCFPTMDAQSKQISVQGRNVRFREQEDFRNFLVDEKIKSLVDGEGCEILNIKDLVPGGTYTFGPSKDGERPTTQTQFRRLLQISGVTPSEEVMNVILKSFASSATLVDTPGQARDLYFEAALLPRSATQIVLQQQGIAVADVFRGSDPSKAVLLHAHRNGRPHILKVATDKSILHEYEVWNSVKTVQQGDAYLVPLEKVEFESAAIEIDDISGGSSAHASVRCGVLMKHYQGTLSQCKIPLTSEVLLRYGRYLYTAVSTLHQAGYCHLDIKPSNVFLFEEACYLGDFGAAVKIGDPIRERTIKYYPNDGDFEAQEETDFYLLAITLLEMFGAIPQASQRSGSYTKQEIHKLIATVETEEVRDFLLSFFAS